MEPHPHSMRVQLHEGGSLTYLTVYPEEYDPNLRYPLVVLLHGFGADMYDLANLTPAIDTRGYVYVCPNAPISVEIGPGATGYAWTTPRSNDPQEAALAEQLLDVFLKEVIEEHRVEPENALLLGFSQGGGMTYRVGLGRPDLFAGLVALSCSIRDPEETRGRLPSGRGQQIFIGHGLQDNVERARSARDFLQSEGYTPSYNEYEMGHEISQEVLDDLVPWIRRVLPPLQRDG